MFKAINKTLVESSPLTKKLIIYSNILSRVLYFQYNIGNYIDADDVINQHEVIFMNGKLSKFEKGGYTQFFLNPEHHDGNNINVICATSSVGNVGLDSPHTRNIF